jgi:hypothetical protein
MEHLPRPIRSLSLLEYESRMNEPIARWRIEIPRSLKAISVPKERTKQEGDLFQSLYRL